MKTIEWLNTRGKIFNNRSGIVVGESFKPVGIQLNSKIEEGKIEEVDSILKELKECEEFKDCNFQLASTADTVIIKSSDILSPNKEIKLCYIGHDIMCENNFIVRATKDSFNLK